MLLTGSRFAKERLAETPFLNANRRLCDPILHANLGYTKAPQALAAVERGLPVDWLHGDLYNDAQWVEPEKYC